MGVAGGIHVGGDGTTSVVSGGCWWYVVENGTTSVVSVGMHVV